MGQNTILRTKRSGWGSLRWQQEGNHGQRPLHRKLSLCPGQNRLGPGHQATGRARDVKGTAGCQGSKTNGGFLPRLPVLGLIRVLLGSPFHRENGSALKEPVLWKIVEGKSRGSGPAGAVATSPRGSLSLLSGHVSSFMEKEGLVTSGLKSNKIQTSNHSLPDPT